MGLVLLRERERERERERRKPRGSTKNIWKVPKDHPCYGFGALLQWQQYIWTLSEAYRDRRPRSWRLQIRRLQGYQDCLVLNGRVDPFEELGPLQGIEGLWFRVQGLGFRV